MFDCFEIPTPFQIGAVNCYLHDRTLIDPGMDSEDAWATLQTHLRERDLTPDDIDQVLITHPHPDHFGLANRLRGHGATIIASDIAADIIRDFDGRLTYEQSYFEPFLVRHGLSKDVAASAVRLPEAFLEFAPDATVDVRLTDGDELEVGDLTVTAMRVEGHAPGELLYTYRDQGRYEAVVGDHVLDPVTPNPFMQPPPEPGDERPRVLPAYNRSLERLAEAGFDQFLPGHRSIIDDPTHRVEQLLRFHEHRTDRVMAAIDGPITAKEVMETLFDSVPLTEVYAAMSEAIGHLDVLEERDLVTVDDSEDRITYDLVDDQ